MSVDYRLYADGTVVHEDDFDEYDHAQPYYDDYEVWTLPDGELEDIDYFDVPLDLINHIKEVNNATETVQDSSSGDDCNTRVCRENQ